MSSFCKSLCAAAAFTLAVPAVVNAASVTSLAYISYDYGNQPGERNAIGDDPVIPDQVIIHDTSTSTGYAQFVEVFDFSHLFGETVHYIEVTLEYARVAQLQPDPNDPSDETGEVWWARVLGADNGTLDDDYFIELPGNGPTVATMSFTLDATDDLTAFSDRADTVTTINSAFATSVAQERVRLRFREETAGADDFALLSASVEVFGTVPLPASGLLLMGAVGGAAALKRRKKTS